MLSRVIRSSWRFALIFWSSSKFRGNIVRMIENLDKFGTNDRTSKNNSRKWCFESKEVGDQGRYSSVHAIVILSLNWLLLFEHFCAGGVPLWRSQSKYSSASRGGFGHLPFYLPPIATAVALCIFSSEFFFHSPDLLSSSSSEVCWLFFDL